MSTTVRRAAAFAFAAALGVPAGAPRAKPAVPAEKTLPAAPPTWESLGGARDPASAWFRDSKFGIYFHWGVYSVPAFGNEWYPRNMHFADKPEYKHHVATYGEPSKFGYHDWVYLSS
jgi:alpha-L-fucosidase